MSGAQCVTTIVPRVVIAMSHQAKVKRPGECVTMPIALPTCRQDEEFIPSKTVRKGASLVPSQQE